MAAEPLRSLCLQHIWCSMRRRKKREEKGKINKAQKGCARLGVGREPTRRERRSRSSALSSRSRQDTSGEMLLRVLEDLSELDFKKFRDALSHGDLRGRSCIPWGRLEKADWMDVKNLMVDLYGEEAALDVAIAVLERIQLRKAAAQLQESREKAQGPAPQPGSSSPDSRRDYKEAVRQAYSRIKDQNARLGESVSLDARYSKLVIVSKYREKEEREHEIMATGRRHMEILQEQASCSIAVGDLFKPNDNGWTPKEVVLLGAAGVGKTMTARKIMLDWACDKMFVEFDYVFYIHCREGHLLTSQASMANLISWFCPGRPPPLDKVLGQPERVLFVIDGFDELPFAFDQPQSELCSEPWEQRPVEVTLSSLFRRRLLAKSSLLVTTRPTALQKLGRCLQCERYAEILGFSEAERKEYFHRFFENTEEAAAAFRLVRGNETLFTMCLVPIVCWIVCTVMKQQLSHPRGLSQSPKTTTGIYILYLSTLLRSLSDRLRCDMPRVLRRLCCLAANGIWNQKVLFEEQEVQEYGLDQPGVRPLFLNEYLFLNDHSCISTYSFIHLSFQEFFAAVFYLLEEDGDALDPPTCPRRDVKELLENYGNSRNHFMLTVRFLFGLLNEDRRRQLEEEMGCKITPRIRQELLAWLQNNPKTQETVVFHNLEIPHCLYELQDEQFVATALEPFTCVHLRRVNISHFDQMVLSYSLKHLPRLESLDLRYCSFLWDDPKDLVGPKPAKQDHRHSQDVEGKQSPIQLLCGALEESGCELKRLSFGFCQLTGACCGALASVLRTKPTLTELDLRWNEDLRDGGVRLLCQGLRRSARQLQTLREGRRWCCFRDRNGCWGSSRAHCGTVPGTGCRCGLTKESCGALAKVLHTSPSLMELDLTDNALGDVGVQRLSKGLRDPTCQLQILRLWNCGLTEKSCGALAEVLRTTPSLTELDLRGNDLRDLGVRCLSDGLRDPTCRLQNLSLWDCRLTGTCCEDLCAVLGTSRSLECLDLSENDLGDRGVRLLCERLRDPTCCLQRLRLQKSGLNEETLQKLDALKEVKPNLNIWCF
ncbi:LOW QUALITY PROTEIN: NACHT, LRR and PYD domains-containing protein 3-like [Aegotheles albertisi]